MKEEIENVREETLIKSEQLQILEKRYSQITHEVSLLGFSIYGCSWTFSRRKMMS
jgi:hypothetical protein